MPPTPSGLAEFEGFFAPFLPKSPKLTPLNSKILAGNKTVDAHVPSGYHINCRDKGVRSFYKAVGVLIYQIRSFWCSQGSVHELAHCSELDSGQDCCTADRGLVARAKEEGPQEKMPPSQTATIALLFVLIVFGKIWQANEFTSTSRYQISEIGVPDSSKNISVFDSPVHESGIAIFGRQRSFRSWPQGLSRRILTSGQIFGVGYNEGATSKVWFDGNSLYDRKADSFFRNPSGCLPEVCANNVDEHSRSGQCSMSAYDESSIAVDYGTFSPLEINHNPCSVHALCNIALVLNRQIGKKGDNGVAECNAANYDLAVRHEMLRFGLGCLSCLLTFIPISIGAHIHLNHGSLWHVAFWIACGVPFWFSGLHFLFHTH